MHAEKIYEENAWPARTVCADMADECSEGRQASVDDVVGHLRH